MNFIEAPFPSFVLFDQHGETWTDDSLKGTWSVLYAYPKDMTPGCTLEAHDFMKWLKNFEMLQVQIIGLSPDEQESHLSFCKKDRISYSLLSDPEKKLLKALSCWKEKSMAGKKFMGVERSTWIIDPAGIIRAQWRNVKVPGHAEEILKTIENLK